MTIRDVVYVVTDPGIPAYGRKGASSHVQSVLRELTRRARATGGRVTLVASRIGGEVPAGLEDVEVVELGRPDAKDPAERERALVELDESAADVVAALLADARERADDAPAPLVYQRYSLWSARTLEVAREAGARTVLEVNAPLVEEQATHRVLIDRPTAEAMTRRALRAAGFVYAVSTPVAAWAQEAGGLPAGSVPAIPNGVDLDRFAVAQRARSAAGPGESEERRGHEVPEELTVAFVGTFRPWHAPEMLVGAATTLDERGIPLRLLLVGEGPNLAETVGAAAAAGLTVESTGAVDPDEVPGILARADLAAAPYPAGDAYFSPLKVAEYLAAGLPTVASGVADLPALFSEDELALVTPGDEEAFTDALGALATDAAARAAMARAGRDAVRARFSWTSIVDRVVEAA